MKRSVDRGGWMVVLVTLSAEARRVHGVVPERVGNLNLDMTSRLPIDGHTAQIPRGFEYGEWGG